MPFFINIKELPQIDEIRKKRNQLTNLLFGEFMKAGMQIGNKRSNSNNFKIKPARLWQK